MTAQFDLEKELARFAKVMAARKHWDEFLSLYDRIEGSDKFSDHVKPYLFVRLMEQSSFRVPANCMIYLIEKLYTSNAAKIAWGALPFDEVAKGARPLVARLFQCVAKNYQDVGHLFYTVEHCGLSPSQGHTVGFMLEAGMDEDEVGHLCDLNHEHLRRCMAWYEAKKSRSAVKPSPETPVELELLA